MQEKDCNQLQKAFHELKGSAAALRAGQLSALAVRLEELSEQSRLDEIIALDHDLQKAFETTIELIETLQHACNVA